jgi:thioredoxin 1
MNRRTLMAALAAVALMLPASPTLAGETLPYREGVVEDLLAEGRTVFVTFSADWCSTCRAQERIIDRYRAATPEIDSLVTFVRVDWDVHSGSEIVVWYDIPRRSTLLALRGDDEIGRIIADTRPSSINALLGRTLAAARTGEAG